MEGPGASEIVLDLTTMDGGSVFIFSVIFQEVGVLHLAFDTDAFPSSLTSGVALVSPAIFNVSLPWTQKNRSRTSCFLQSVPRAVFPAVLRCTSQEGAWHGPTVAR